MSTNPQNDPDDPQNEKAIICYINHLVELWNIELLKGNTDQIQNTKKVIACFIDPRNNWLFRTKQGLCLSANLKPNELEDVLIINKSTFMTDTHTNNITLRLKILNLTRQVITHIYKLDEF